MEMEGEEANRISIEQLRRLVQLLDQSDVSEVELRRPEEGTHLVLRKVRLPEGTVSGAMAQGIQGMPEGRDTSGSYVSAGAFPVEPTPVKRKHAVVAALVGIFHSSAKPRVGALVGVGDRVKVGQLMAMIESLNVFNEVESPVAGRVVEILVQEGQAIEYGQPLMSIESEEGTET